ncbi:phosphoenolpyruvate carboxykinase [bacterium]|nr:MAG: phosphoenolpyruvate carboxykinase [bacterium]
MENITYQLFDGKVILRVRDKVCTKPEHLLASRLFQEVLRRYIADLERKRSRLLNIFASQPVGEKDIDLLVSTFRYLLKVPADLVPRLDPASDQFFRDRYLFNEFIEQLYNYWRRLHRLIICDSIDDRLDKRPYRTFSDTVETLMHVVRSTYRDLQENVTGNHPRIYRQVSAGAEVAAIALPKELKLPEGPYRCLNDISVIRQVLIYPPMIYNSPMNKRKGEFERVERNPLDGVEVNPKDWLCYPAKVGPLLVLVYFTLSYFELGFSLSNLFEMASDEDLERQPDAVYLFGVAPAEQPVVNETIFFDDAVNDILVGTIPYKDEYGYFGYLKKMILTLHNIKMMKQSKLPFHGALMNITLRNHGSSTILVMGDSGAGKSETLEALRQIAGDDVEDIITIADDMGSLALDEKNRLIGYGTEIGAFVRLDDLQSGYALGQIDRTIIMNPDQVNARVVLPVTRYEEVVKGYPVDYVLYANNYDVVDPAHPSIESFNNPADALEVFRTGAVMSKGTTAATGLVHTYFANIFGPSQYQQLHEPLAKRFFQAMFDQGIYVGQMRTQLAIHGCEQSGPRDAARELLDLLREKA